MGTASSRSTAAGGVLALIVLSFLYGNARNESPPQVRACADHTQPAAKSKVHFPLAIHGDMLHVVTNPTEGTTRRVGQLELDPGTGRRYLRTPIGVQRIVIDIGTNVNPESWGAFGTDPSTAMIWFEPVPALQQAAMAIPGARDDLTRFVPRIFPVNAAVSPKAGHALFNLAAESGCNSLLAMNEAGQKNEEIKAAPGFMANCLKPTARVPVPLVRGSDIVELIPPYLETPYLGIDAQGFDLSVAASFGKSMKRFGVVMIECQDLPPGDDKIIVQGAYTCTEVLHCMGVMHPEFERVNLQGEPENWCSLNNGISKEYNCVFRQRGRPMIPVPTGGAGGNITAPMRSNIECPSMERPAGVASI